MLIAGGMLRRLCFFFFQAEDGIRDRNVTGVQTCALPIYRDGTHGSDAPTPASAAAVPGPMAAHRMVAGSASVIPRARLRAKNVSTPLALVNRTQWYEASQSSASSTPSHAAGGWMATAGTTTGSIPIARSRVASAPAWSAGLRTSMRGVRIIVPAPQGSNRRHDPADPR